MKCDDCDLEMMKGMIFLIKPIRKTMDGYQEQYLVFNHKHEKELLI